MKLAIMQPYFMPYLGYWQLLANVDYYVVFDDVNYIKKGWINRNNILVNGIKTLFTIPLKNASQNKLINEIEISDDFQKLSKTIQMAYSKAPYFKDVWPILDAMFHFEDKNLSRFIKHSFDLVSEYLHLNTKLVLSSELKNRKELKAQSKIIDICKLLNADTYINAIGGMELYDNGIFTNEGIQLKFLHPHLPEYKQFNNTFVPGLSMIDVLMFNSPATIALMLNDFTLISNANECLNSNREAKESIILGGGRKRLIIKQLPYFYSACRRMAA